MKNTSEAIIQLNNISLSFTLPGRTITALNKISLDVKAGQITGLIGPDGAGKTTLMRLLSGLLKPDSGQATVLGMDVVKNPQEIQSVIGYMPQRFGLYEDLTVQENMDLYADLHNIPVSQRASRYEKLLSMSQMAPFTSRLAGKLSGGMKQKLGLACALVSPPRLLILDEPTVGVDPVSRRELWQIINQMLQEEHISVLMSTAYLDEAERCDDVILMHEGRILDQASPDDFSEKMHNRTFQAHSDTLSKRHLQFRLSREPGVLDALIDNDDIHLVMHEPVTDGLPVFKDIDNLTIHPTRPHFEDAFIALLKKNPVVKNTSIATTNSENKDKTALSIEDTSNNVSEDTTESIIKVDKVVRRFGDFYAVKGISFEVKKGEIFGLLGANGAGKSTLFRMLCGLLPVSDGRVEVAGHNLRTASATARAHIGYMAQRFSLYTNLTIKQNLMFFSKAYGLRGKKQQERIQWALDEFELQEYLNTNSNDLPLGYKQRLAFAAALMHEPDILFLDEPTSGVDPLARREFWQRTNALAESGVTVLVTTHFMDEANYCDRLIIMASGTELATGSPEELRSRFKSEQNPQPSMEDTFIALVESKTQQGQPS